MMVGGRNRDIKPLLLKVGVAFALSFAGFLFSRLKTRKMKPCLPPPRSPCSSDKESEVDLGVRPRRKDDLNATRISHSSCNSEKYDEMHMPKVCNVNCTSSVSPCSKHGGGKDGLLLPVFNELVEEFDFGAANSGFSPRKNVETSRSDAETPKAYRSDMDEYEQEIRHLRNIVRSLRERERSLEVQLLEYYGLKEQETAVMELQNQLKINGMEAKLFSLKIQSLEADNRRLESQVADHAKVVAELEATRAKIKILKKKLRFEAEQNKEQILALKKRVEKFHDSEAADSNSDIQLKLRRIKDLEDEAEELKKSNLKLQLENSELARSLESTQILANSILEDPEAEALKEMSKRLRQENDGLTKEIQQLHVDRCSDVEELVYLRWINACLRYELRNYQPQSGKTVARDLSKSLSPRSEEKAKQLIVEYANTEGFGDKSIDFDSEHWSSSQASFFTDSPEFDDFSVDNSSATKTNTSSKTKLFSKLRRLIQGKDTPYHNQAVSTEKTGYAEDIESPSLFFSSSKSPAAYGGQEGQSNIFATSFHISSKASLDLPRWRSPKEQDTKDLRRAQRHSDVGTPSGYKTFSREGSADFPLKDRSDQDSDSTEKAELVKYAEALVNSRGATPNVHRKSASAS